MIRGGIVPEVIRRLGPTARASVRRDASPGGPHGSRFGSDRLVQDPRATASAEATREAAGAGVRGVAEHPVLVQVEPLELLELGDADPDGDLEDTEDNGCADDAEDSVADYAEGLDANAGAPLKSKSRLPSDRQ